MDLDRARQNMIEQQIRPWEVLDPEVLDLLFVVKREDFVPPAYRAMAFVDMDVPLLVDGQRTGETMFSPKLEARLLQSLAVRRHESVLEIGAGSGYMAALLAHRARHVISAEIHTGLAQLAKSNLNRAAIHNVKIAPGNGLDLLSEQRGFDVIMVSGRIDFVPDPLMQALNDGGRLCAIVGQPPIMSAKLIRRVGSDGANGGFIDTDLFETAAPPMHGFPVRERFKF